MTGKTDVGIRAPEIFVIGTMKGGTTILHDYICTHPRVVPGEHKEIHYFSLYPDRGENWYLNKFPARPANCLTIDASPTYFDVADRLPIPERIKNTVSHPKLILMIRDPVERAISHFQHLRKVSHPAIYAEIDVNEFLSRSVIDRSSSTDPSDENLSYVLRFSIYDKKFERYVEVFGRENILVVTTDEMRNDAISAMRRVFAHCNLEWSPSETFGTQRYLSGSERLMINKAVRSRLEEAFYPSYDRFLKLASLPARLG